MRPRLRPLALLVVATLALGACGGTSTPALTDPKEIVTKAVEALQNAKAVHLDVSVEGSLKADLLGTGQGAGDMSLAGTTVSGDLDLANKNAHISAAVPAFLGLTADIIVVGADTYTKVSLVGDQYQKSSTTAGAPTDPATAIQEVKDFLDKPEIAPTKKDDAKCGSKTCYAVDISLSADELKALIPEQDLGDASIVVSILVEKDTLYPASLSATISGTKVGEITITISLSNWDRAVTITAPPADEIQ